MRGSSHQGYRRTGSAGLQVAPPCKGEGGKAATGVNLI